MDAELKAKWVRALRSGRYKQQFNRLHSNMYSGNGDILTAEALCCIGVGIVCNGMDAVVTGDAARQLGLTEKQKDILVTMNDVARKPFSEIADYIEREL